jgi:hypothetical protein
MSKYILIFPDGQRIVFPSREEFLAAVVDPLSIVLTPKPKSGSAEGIKAGVGSKAATPRNQVLLAQQCLLPGPCRNQ